jgi:hypothetical protein
MGDELGCHYFVVSEVRRLDQRCIAMLINCVHIHVGRGQQRLNMTSAKFGAHRAKLTLPNPLGHRIVFQCHVFVTGNQNPCYKDAASSDSRFAQRNTGSASSCKTTEKITTARIDLSYSNPMAALPRNQATPYPV